MDDSSAQAPGSVIGRGTLLAILLISLAIRIGALVVHPPADDGDQQLYRMLARGIAGGTGYLDGNGNQETTVHPLLPLLHAAALYVVPGERAAGMVVTLLVGALVPAAAAWCVASGFGRVPALLAACLLALQPHHVLASQRLEPDLLAACLSFGLALALARGRWVVAGALLGLAYLNRPEAVFWLPAAAAFAWVRGASGKAIAGSILVIMLLASPFLVFVRSVEGRWALSGKDRWQYMLGVHQYRSGDQPLERRDVSRLRDEIHSPIEHLRSNPREFVLGYTYRAGILARNLLRQTGWGLLVPFAAVGIAVGLRRSPAALWALLVPLTTLPVLPLVATLFRHSQVPGTVILALAGLGFSALVENFGARGLASGRRG